MAVTGSDWATAAQLLEQASMAFRGATTAAPAETGEQHQANFVALFTSLSDSQRGHLAERIAAISAGGYKDRNRRRLADSARGIAGLSPLDPTFYGLEAEEDGRWTMRSQLAGVDYVLRAAPRVEVTEDGRKILHFDRGYIGPDRDDWQDDPDAFRDRAGLRAVRGVFAELAARLARGNWDDVRLHFHRGFGSDSSSVDQTGTSEMSLRRRIGARGANCPS